MDTLFGRHILRQAQGHEGGIHVPLEGFPLFQKRASDTRQQADIAQIGGVVKELAQNRVSCITVRLQELAELTLGQHDDLGELAGIHAQQLRDAVGYF